MWKSCQKKKKKISLKVRYLSRLPPVLVAGFGSAYRSAQFMEGALVVPRNSHATDLLSHPASVLLGFQELAYNVWKPIGAGALPRTKSTSLASILAF